MQANK